MDGPTGLVERALMFFREAVDGGLIALLKTDFGLIARSAFDPACGAFVELAVVIAR